MFWPRCPEPTTNDVSIIGDELAYNHGEIDAVLQRLLVNRLIYLPVNSRTIRVWQDLGTQWQIVVLLKQPPVIIGDKFRTCRLRSAEI